MVSFLFGCRKYDSLPNTNSPNYAQLQQQFFNTGTTADIAIKKLAADIRRQDSLFHFLPAFVKKNGIPRWDKVVYSSNHSNSGSQLSTYGVNAAGSLTKHSQNSTNEGSQGIFFIPLQAQNANTIQSYIVAYKHNDSLYTYRLYNRDSLNAIRPKTSIAKNNLLNTQAVFGYFEQTVNNRDGITIESPVSGKIKNVEIAFHATRNNHVNSTQSLNGTMASVSCEMSIEVTISYSLEVTLDGNTIYITESYSVSLTIIIDCTGGGSCNCATPKDNIIDGVGGTGNTNGNWWDYGTGYPYFPWNPSGISGGSGPYEPDWSWWWTGGGSTGGGGFPYEIIPDPNVLGNFVDDPNVFEDDPTQVTFDYDQNPWPNISNVLSPSQFVGYDYRNCLDLTKDQIAKAGLRDLGYGSAFKVYDANGGPYPSIAKSGINYIITKLQAGKPVIVGVDNRPGTPSSKNADGKTDHFITIVGTGQDSQGKYLTFYDNATNLTSKGCSSNNKLYYNENTGIITGFSAANGAPPTYYDYIVTQIRKNQ